MSTRAWSTTGRRMAYSAIGTFIVGLSFLLNPTAALADEPTAPPAAPKINYGSKGTVDPTAQAAVDSGVITILYIFGALGLLGVAFSIWAIRTKKDGAGIALAASVALALFCIAPAAMMQIGVNAAWRGINN